MPDNVRRRKMNETPSKGPVPKPAKMPSPPAQAAPKGTSRAARPGGKLYGGGANQRRQLDALDREGL